MQKKIHFSRVSNGGKKIVLISTGQPATNPRLVKEATSLSEAGYEVTVLYSFVISWANVFDRQLLSLVKWRFQCIGGSPEKNKGLYLVTRIRYKLARLINAFTNGVCLAERAEARAFDELLGAAKKIKADIYIGHNLGALPVAVKAAKYHVAKSGFDFEDYHRGEFAATDNNRKRITSLEKKYLAELSYYSGSSPMITEAVAKDHPGLKANAVTLLNCFPYRELAFMQPVQDKEKILKLFWFSQTIGRNRGLETILAALNQLANPAISMTLVGRCSKEMEASLKELSGLASPQVCFAGLVPPDQLPAFAGQFDIGLAGELSFPVNRDLCLTNKIFTYISSGLCILASDTSAQTDLLSLYPAIGFIYRKDEPSDLARLIQKLFQDNNLLISCKKASRILGETRLNWENESRKLLRLIEEL